MGDSMAERMDAGWQAARHWESECEAARNQLAAVTAQRDALNARVELLEAQARSHEIVVAERDAALAELAEAKRVAEAATEVYLKKFDADTATMELKSDAFKNLAEMAYSYAEACGMQNYVEATVRVGPLQAKDGEELFFVTLQRMDGKTPHELKLDAERERDEARTRAASWEIRCVSKEDKLAALQKRLADAPKTHAQVQHTACWIDEIVPQAGLYALVRLEDGE